jgi:O-Antigen ligase
MTDALFPLRTATVARAGDDLGERCLYWFLVLTPLWWLLGLLAPLATLGTMALFLRRPPRDPAALACALAWMLAGAAQAASGLVAWVSNGETLAELPFRVASMPVTGWVLLGAAIGVGAEYRLASARIVRAASVYGSFMLLFGLGAMIVAVATGRHDLEMTSPVAMLVPLTPDDMRQQFAIRFLITDDAFLDEGGMPRLILFFPWSTGLAMAGMAAAAVALSDRSAFWRANGVAGGIFGLLFSLSRAALVAAALAYALIGFARLGSRLRLAIAAAAAAALNLAIASGIDFVALAQKIMHAFNEAREGSSQAREWIYEASWRGFLDATILGHGGIGPIYNSGVPVRLGSHSTFYGTLYTGGVVTFGAIALAYVTTLVVLALRLRGGGRFATVAFGLWAAFGMLCYGEAMYSLVPSCLALFVWIGAGMSCRPTRADAAA